jgi:hypothetical protein
MPEHKTLKDGTILTKTSYSDLISDATVYSDGTLAAVLTASNIESLFIKEPTKWRLLSELPIISDSFPPPEYENRLLVYKNKAIFNSIIQSNNVVWKLISQTPDSVSAIPSSSGEFTGELRLNTVLGILYQWNGTAWSTPSGYTNENAQDAVASALVSGIHTGIEFLYTSVQDNANRIDAKLKLAGNGLFGFWSNDMRRITIGSGLSLNTTTYELTASGGGTPLRYETQQYLARINTTGVSQSKINDLNKFIDTMIVAGIYQKWDCVYIDTGIADNFRQNVISNQFTLDGGGGTLTVVPYEGVTESGGYLISSMSYVPIIANTDTIAKFKLNSSSFAMYIPTVHTLATEGTYFRVNNTYLYAPSAPSQAISSVINQASTQPLTIPANKYSSMIQGSRNGNDVNMVSGTFRVSQSIPVGAAGDSNLFLQSNAVFSFLALGGGMTNQEQNLIKTAFETYLGF